MTAVPTLTQPTARRVVLSPDRGVLLADADVALLRVLTIVLPRFGVTVETTDSPLDTVTRREPTTTHPGHRRQLHHLTCRCPRRRPASPGRPPHRPGLRTGRRGQVQAICGAGRCLRKPFPNDSLLDVLEAQTSAR